MRHADRRTWFVLHPAYLWYVRNGSLSTGHSFGVDRANELDDRLARLVGRLAGYRAEARILVVDWSDLVKQAAGRGA